VTLLGDDPNVVDVVQVVGTHLFTFWEELELEIDDPQFYDQDRSISSGSFCASPKSMDI